MLTSTSKFSTFLKLWWRSVYSFYFWICQIFKYWTLNAWSLVPPREGYRNTRSKHYIELCLTGWFISKSTSWLREVQGINFTFLLTFNEPMWFLQNLYYLCKEVCSLATELLILVQNQHSFPTEASLSECKNPGPLTSWVEDLIVPPFPILSIKRIGWAHTSANGDGEVDG